MKRKSIIMMIVVSTLLMLLPTMAWGANSVAEGEQVYVIPIEDTIEPGLAAYIERNLQQAISKNVDAIIFEMDTPGGRVDAAQEIKRMIFETGIPTIVLVKDQAISAGAYIALACEKIAMQPGSTIGDAEMRIGGEKADEKYLSPWREEFGALAEARGRDPEIAKAFVDREIAIEGIVEQGKLLTLTPNRALELGMADYVVDDLNGLLQVLGYDKAQVIYGEMTGGERFARFVTDPMVAPVLLSLGIICVVMEFFTPGFGIFAGLGILFLGLYFGGHMVAGMASWFALLLFLIGIILCAVEIFVPGFGIFGILGVGSIIGSIFLTTPDVETAVRYSAIVLAIAVAMVPIMIKLMSKGKVFDRLTVKETLTTEKGYTARKANLADFVGREGVAATVLRPAGSMVLEDQTKLDVVTRGDFIEAGEKVKVIAVDGTWLVVQRTD